MTELSDPRRLVPGLLQPVPPWGWPGMIAAHPPEMAERRVADVAPFPRAPFARAAPAAPPDPGPLARLHALLVRWDRRMRDRRELRDLALREPDAVLADIGITREEAAALGRRPFWRA